MCRLGIFKVSTKATQPTTVAPGTSLPGLASLLHKRPFTGIQTIQLRTLSVSINAAIATSIQPSALPERTFQVSSHLPPPHFSDLPLDRAGHLRRQTEALDQLLQHPSARVLAFYERKALVAPLASLKEENLPPSVAASPPTLEQEGVSSSNSVENDSPQAVSLAPLGEEVPDGGPPSWVLLTWHPSSPELSNAINSDVGYIFLGLSTSGAPYFACQLTTLPSSVGESNRLDVFMVDVRSQGQKMTGPDAAVIALASGLFQWHANSGFCSKTGAVMTPQSGGHARRALTSEEGSLSTSPGERSQAVKKRPRAVYPRMDPAVIVAVTYGDWLLLGRKKTWDKGRYSLLAGFAEVGETLEAAVVREVSEESSVFVDFSSIQYHSSQPWPFPQSLMIGFLGEAHCSKASPGSKPLEGFEVLPPSARAAAIDVGLKSHEATAYALPAVDVDADELEDARWFHKEWLLEKILGVMRHGPQNEMNTTASNDGADDLDSDLQLNFRIPGKYALANRIITDWLLGAAAPKSSSDNQTNNNVASSSEKLPSSWRSGAAIPSVALDQGTFKYVLLRVSGPGGTPSKLLVRGDTRAAYHNHIFTACKAEVAAVDPQLSVQVLGGGRIEHYSSPAGGIATIYGYSAAYGPAPHEITAAVLRQCNPFLEVSVSYEGY